MATAISCVDRTALQKMLVLPGESPERHALNAHLSQCDVCRGLLLEITSEAMRVTGSVAPKSEAMTTDLSGSRTQDRPVTGNPISVTQTRVREADFIEPSSQPEHLGRLAHYELLEVIGRGGMGSVFKAHDETLHRTVAVKLMSPELAVSDTSRQRFIREARAAAQVTHEHVVTIHAVDDKGRVPFLVMQYVAGKSLQQRLQDGPLPTEEIVRIGREMAEGLAAAHAKGLVHRDIKPGNVLLEEPSGKVKITDFGLARAVDDASISQSGAVIGTPLYMAPEQARGEALDHRADLFSLGAVLYALCTGQSPFRANTSLAAMKRVCDDDPEPIHSVNQNIPAWLEKIIRKLLAKKPDDRFQSATEVSQLLGRRLERLRAGVVDFGERSTEISRKVPKSKSRLSYFVIAASTLLIGGIAAIVWYATRTPKNDDNQQVIKRKDPTKDTRTAKGSPPIEINPLPIVPNANIDPTQLFNQLMQNHPLFQPGGRLPIDPIADNPIFQNPELFNRLFQPFGIGGGGMNPPQPGSMANSADGKLLAIPVGSHVAIMGNDQMPAIESVSAPVQCVAISPDNRWLIGGCEAKSKNLMRWDLKTGKIQTAKEGHRGEINSVSFGPASRFVTTSNDGTAKVWTITGQTPTVSFKEHKDFVRCAIFLPGPMRVASGGDDKVVRIWEASEGKQIKELPGHTAPIRCIAVSPSGKVLATGSDRELKLWNAETFEEFLTEQTPAGWLAFSPDNLSIFTAGCDHSQGTVHHVTVWNTRDWGKRKEYDLKSRGGQAVYHLSADGGVIFGNRPSAVGDSSPVAAYRSLTGEPLMK